MDLMDVIRARRSARSFKPDPIPNQVLHEILEAGRLAPSPGNCQSWLFGVVQDPDLRRQLAAAAGEQHWIASAPSWGCFWRCGRWGVASCKRLLASPRQWGPLPARTTALRGRRHAA